MNSLDRAWDIVVSANVGRRDLTPKERQEIKDSLKESYKDIIKETIIQDNIKEENIQKGSLSPYRKSGEI